VFLKERQQDRVPESVRPFLSSSLWYQAYAGEPVLKGEDFKQYVNLLREKSLTYKQKRADLSDLKAEYGVLERTLEVLKYVRVYSFLL
jgi:hypothetical protein